MNQKLREIGSKLNVSNEDIRNIQNTSFGERLVRIFIHPALRLILAILTFILGVSLGGGCTNCAGYPYAAAVTATAIPEKKKKSIVYSILLPIITLIAGYLIGKQFFSYAILYNVYRRS